MSSPNQAALHAPEGAPILGTRSGLLTRLLIVAVVNIMLVVMMPREIDPWRLAFASGLLWMCWLPWELHRWRREVSIPIVPAVSVVSFIYYGAPVFLDSVYHQARPYDRPEVTTAVGIALLAQVILVLTCYSPVGAIVRYAPKLRLEVDLARLRTSLLIGAGVLFPISVLALHSKMGFTIGSVVMYILHVPLLFLTALFVLHLRGQLTTVHQIGGLALYIAYMANGFATGSLSHVMVNVAALVFVYFTERRRLPWAAILVGALFVFPFLTTKFAYREYIANNPQLGVVDRVAVFLSLTGDAIERGGTQFVRNATETSKARTSMLGTLAFVIEATPSRVPYWGGETYELVLWSAVPRILYPDKPKKGLGQLFPHRYGLLFNTNYNTSYNFPILVEMYANFGTWAVMLGMLIVGLIYRLLQRLFNHGTEGGGFTAMSALLFTNLLNIESDAGLLFGYIPWALLLYILALFAVARVSGARATLVRVP